jgi:hypothetical protein
MARHATQFICEYRIDVGQAAPDGTPIKTDRFKVGLHHCRSILVEPGLVVVELEGERPMTVFLTAMGPAIYEARADPRTDEGKEATANASRKERKTVG